MQPYANIDYKLPFDVVPLWKVVLISSEHKCAD